MILQQIKTGQRFECVEPVVEDVNLHLCSMPAPAVSSRGVGTKCGRSSAFDASSLKEESRDKPLICAISHSDGSGSPSEIAPITKQLKTCAEVSMNPVEAPPPVKGARSNASF